MSELDRLLERMVPGAGRPAVTDPDAPPFPAGIGLAPLGLLARGGTGYVFRAHDPVLDRIVAVKIARPDGGEAARRALLDEARATAALAGPGVLPLHGVIAADGQLCVVFSLAPHRTLADRIARWRVEPAALEARLRCLAEIGSAVARAHALSFTHGDLKPSNITIDDDDRPFVLDWGGAGAEPGTFSGTPEYAAPERIRGDPPAPAADVWALGAIAWEVLAGRALRPAVPSESTAEYLARHAVGRPADSAGLAALDADIAATLARAVDPDPAARPGARALVEVLEAALTGRADRARRQIEASRLLRDTDRDLATFRERERRLDEEKRVIAVQRAKVPPWAPPADKRTLWAATERLLALTDDQADVWTRAIEQAIVASALVPAAADARIAELWWARLRMAEYRGYAGEARLAERRIRERDPDGRFASLLDAQAFLSLAGEGRVALAPVARGPRYTEGPMEVQANLPLVRRALRPGSWMATAETPGCPPVRIAIHLNRLDHVELVVPRCGRLPDGFVVVAAGPFRMGGDEGARAPVEPSSPWLPTFAASIRPVTSQAWLRFLAVLPPAEADRKAPTELLANGRSVPLWDRGPGGWQLPPAWDPEWPIVGVDQASVAAYAAWASEQLGVPLRLPTEEEWEKAARGADGRVFPWGDAFDSAFCHTKDSVAGAARLARVGAFATDRSPYGLLDTAGLVQEWTSSTFALGRVVVRGGSWADDAQASRLASRTNAAPDERRSTLGFRLVTDAF